MRNTIRSSKRRKQAAFTLTEIVIVLGVVGIVLGAIFVAASSARKHVYTNQATDELNMIANNLRNFYSSQAAGNVATSAWAAATPNMIQSGIFPAEMLSPQPDPGVAPCAGTVANNPWSLVGGTCGGAALGSAQIQILAAGGATRAQFVIRYTNVPEDQCVGLIMTNSDTSAQFGLTSITITGGGGPIIYSVAGGTLPVSAANANAACTTAAAVTIDWSYNTGG